MVFKFIVDWLPCRGRTLPFFDPMFSGYVSQPPIRASSSETNLLVAHCARYYTERIEQLCRPRYSARRSTKPRELLTKQTAEKSTKTKERQIWKERTNDVDARKKRNVGVFSPLTTQQDRRFMNRFVRDSRAIVSSLHAARGSAELGQASLLSDVNGTGKQSHLNVQRHAVENQVLNEWNRKYFRGKERLSQLWSSRDKRL